MRLFSVYGTNQRPDLVVYKFFNQILKNQPIEIYGNGHTTRDYTYIDDVVNALYSSVEFLKNMKSETYEIINIGNDDPISLKTLLKHIKTTIGNNNLQVLEKKYVKGDVNNTHANIDKARKNLNYNPEITIENGIKLFYIWYINDKHSYSDFQDL